MDSNVTRREVAERAGVSKTTVSRVINNSGYVSEATRRRVLAAIQELKYRPNRVARGLKTKQTYHIGYLVHDLLNPYYFELGKGIEKAALEHNYLVSWCDAEYGFEERLETFLEHRMDGLIITLELDPKRMRRLCQLIADGVPVVTSLNFSGNPGFGVVQADEAGGAQQAVAHLCDWGHRRIAFVSRQVRLWENFRFQGYQRALKMYGIKFSQDWIVHIPEELGDTFEGGRAGLELLLRRCPDVTAAFLFNDLMAAGFIAAAQSMGLKIPEDISVVAFDDIAMARMLRPALTTVHIPKMEQGCKLFETLLEAITNHKMPEVITLPTRLVKRETVGPPREGELLELRV